jgi:hypothetical protein
VELLIRVRGLVDSSQRELNRHGRFQESKLFEQLFESFFGGTSAATGASQSEGVRPR